MKYTTYFAIWLGAIFYNFYRELFVWDGTSRQGDGIINVFLCVVKGFVGLFPFYWINQKIEKSKAKKEAQEKESADKKEQAESARASKKASEKRKKELIEKYGEEDGMLIFKRKISEKNYKKKKELIKKYGEEDGMSIFEGEISEKNYKKKKELIKKYGEKFGLAVFEKKVHKDMSLAIVEAAISKHKYKDGNDYYFGKPFNRKIVIVKDKVIEDKPFKDGIWMDMPKKMLTASWGRAGEKKETVTKSSIKQRLFFNGRKNRQGSTSYEYQVDVEDDLVVGWKELE